MKIKMSILLAVSGLLILAACWIQGPTFIADTAHANAIPEKYQDTVNKGLEFLASKQHPDGHWEGDDGKHPVATTALVGLALLMDIDNTNNRGFWSIKVRKMNYSSNIRKAADWLMTRTAQERDGLIFSEHASEADRYMEGHGLATLFLAGALRLDHDETRRRKLTEVITRAVKYIAKAQSTQGGWHRTSKVEGHDFAAISTTVIQVQALHAAENIGVAFPPETFRDARTYLTQLFAAKPGQESVSAVDVAGLLACRDTNPWRPGQGMTPAEKAAADNWLKYCQSETPVGKDVRFGRDELAHYYLAQAILIVDQGVWSDYRKVMFDHLQSSQHKGGSWPASEGLSVGPVYATALWCVVLQLDKKSHPGWQDEPRMIT